MQFRNTLIDVKRGEKKQKKKKPQGENNEKIQHMLGENEKNITVLKFSMQCPLIPTAESKLEEF